MELGDRNAMTVETKIIKVNKDTKLEQLTEEARNNPIIFEINGSAYSLNPIGNSSSPFTVPLKAPMPQSKL